DNAASRIHTLSLHDALPICRAIRRPTGRPHPCWRRAPLCRRGDHFSSWLKPFRGGLLSSAAGGSFEFGENFGAMLIESRCTPVRSEEHTSELQSRENVVCRL